MATVFCKFALHFCRQRFMRPDTFHIIEALIFTAEQPLKVPQMLAVFDKAEFAEHKPNKEDIKTILKQIVEKYAGDEYPFEVKQLAGGYQFFTKVPYFPYVRHAALIRKRKRMSKVMMETLAIIAYRQPVTKGEIEFIRGVNCDYAVQKLLERKLVDIKGRSEAPGRPLLYGTSEFFFEYFGLKDAADLPKLKEFEELEEEHLKQFKQHQQAEADKIDNTIKNGKEEFPKG